MLADQVDFVIGVDAHRDVYALALVAARTGACLFECELAADAPGYRRALALALEHAAGARAWAIEGTGCYGAGLTAFLLEQRKMLLGSRSAPREAGSGPAAAE
jgi:transposase